MQLTSNCLTIILATLSSGCCNLPSNLPELIDLNIERLETKSEVAAQALESTVTKADLAAQDVTAASELLKTIDCSKLAADQQQACAQLSVDLAKISTSLSISKQVRSVPGALRSSTREITETDRLVRRMIADNLDKQQVVNDAIQLIKGKKEEPK